MSESKWEKIFDQLKELHAQGQSAEVLKKLRAINKKSVPKQWRSLLADLARRGGDPLLSLKILVHGQSSVLAIQSDTEKLHYAAGLIALGNVPEAHKWLEKIKDPHLAMEGDFFKALAMIRHWDYEQALTTLEKFLKKEKPNGYRELVVRLNIVACLVALDRLDDIADMIGLLKQDLEKAKAQLLLYNLTEIEVQVAFLKKEALNEIKNEKHFENSSSHQTAGLFFRKWKLLSQMGKISHTDFINELRSLRHEALRLEHWETLRDLDFSELLFQPNRDIYTRLYRGTPFPVYRARLSEFNLQIENDLPVGPWGKAAKINPWPLLTHGSVNDRLFRVLLSDLYRPLSLGEIFSSVYPDEYFNPESSPTRVQRNLFRFREWLLEQKWGMDLEISKGAYQLKFQKALRIALPSHESPELLQIQKEFAKNWFHRKLLQERLRLSERSARRLLNEWLQQGLIELQNETDKTPKYRTK